ncbi:SRPBCC domain-containing protein [Agrococcus sediminis]|jgi:hypothetical protein|uniref:SRPBCC domain-containing protein n=1 Tax=Agrococcus TaxID=46352 RepID=UPI001FF69E54|nr:MULTISPECIES: SRPBCC domain-containing protein [unclassified Agrococcus]MDR7235225.1 hypothetical protein [Agrococcus sp. BE272]UOW01332.1 SRPBCC domain-containing protein [Agrococcus sp. SCSIO52902]
MDEHDVAQPAAGHGTAPIEHELDVAVSRARAWDAYVHGMTDWWHPGWTTSGSGLDHIEVDPHVGGRIVERNRDGREREWGTVTDAVPGERFEHTFHLFHEGDHTTVTVEFADLPHGGTHVRFSHHGWNESNAGDRAGHLDWEALLQRYKSYAQHI